MSADNQILYTCIKNSAILNRLFIYDNKITKTLLINKLIDWLFRTNKNMVCIEWMFITHYTTIRKYGYFVPSDFPSNIRLHFNLPKNACGSTQQCEKWKNTLANTIPSTLPERAANMVKNAWQMKNKELEQSLRSALKIRNQHKASNV